MGLGLLGTPMTGLDGIVDLMKDRIGYPVLNVSCCRDLDPGVRVNFIFWGMTSYRYGYVMNLLSVFWVSIFHQQL